MSSRRRRTTAVLSWAIALMLVPVSSAAAAVTEFGGLTVGAPVDIATGPDRALWFTQQGVPGGVGRMTTDGSVTEYAAGLTPGFSLAAEPAQIAAGSDGALWFTEQGNGGAIGRLDPETGAVTEYTAGLTFGSRPAGIALGPDGNLWFAEQARDAIGRITPDGVITEFTAGLSADSEPTDIAAGRDGNLWFTERADPGRIGRIDPSTGVITEFSAGLTPESAPGSIVAGSNGKLYFTQSADPGRIGRIRADGRIEEYSSGFTAGTHPAGIAEGGDGAIWFTAANDPGRVGRLWPDSIAFSELAGGVTPGFTADAAPAGITRGPDGNIWFTQTALGGRIARVTVPPLAAIETPAVTADGKVRLKALIGPNGQPTSYHFEYGADTEYGDATEVASAGDGGATEVSADVELARDARHHVRVIATNASGTAVSSDRQFYLTKDGRIVKERPEDKVGGTSVVSEAASAAPVDAPASELPPVAAPVLGESVAVTPVTGTVRVKPPGTRAYVPLVAGASIAVGSLVDTRRGTVRLRSARNRAGATQKGTFWGAIFQVRQPRGGRGMTSLVLRGGSFTGCPSGLARAGSVAPVASVARDGGGRRRVVRRLWGRDRNGRFRTQGRDSVATVRGTEWTTTDRCDGTLTRVREGAVLVRDLRRKRSVLLGAGHSYLARHRR
jgi:streptogramin lyase